MAGLVLRDFNNNKRYNSAVLFQGDSISNIYNKQRLVPHVEHTPEIFNKLGLNLIEMGRYNIGEKLSLFNVNNPLSNKDKASLTDPSDILTINFKASSDTFPPSFSFMTFKNFNNSDDFTLDKSNL